MTKKICIVYTGGTIGMKRSDKGYETAPGFLKEYLSAHPAVNHPEVPDLHFIEYDPLIDSANMTPDHWNALAKTIQLEYDKFDGFVVLHGTDTMAYTASVLSFMLEHLSKPVIITGSQIPIGEIRSDAIKNLMGAITIAAHYTIPEVCIFFDTYLFRGNRAKKVDATGFGAFKSPNFPALARVGVNIDVRSKLVLPMPEQPLSIVFIKPCDIAILRLYPGIQESSIAKIITQPVKAVVLETFGLGNIPNDNQALFDLFRQATEQGILLINVSQCVRAKVNMNAYATAHDLKVARVLSGHDMTIEAVIGKLYYLLSQKLSMDELRARFEYDLRGEMEAMVCG
jgi:L-asparaginase